MEPPPYPGNQIPPQQPPPPKQQPQQQSTDSAFDPECLELLSPGWIVDGVVGVADLACTVTVPAVELAGKAAVTVLEATASAFEFIDFG